MRRSSNGDGGRAGPVGPASRQVLAIAVVFAVLGGALVRFATGEPPPGVLWAALSVVVVAAVTLFGADAVETALRVLGRRGPADQPTDRGRTGGYPVFFIPAAIPFTVSRSARSSASVRCVRESRSTCRRFSGST
ncbi:hypothetical protein SAMN05443636_1008 [Halobaculum gomorrense]|uniref:Uncharacterized protein n=1 Tax=Halobaculum gomorrense TaxID=43928 RepID=A0A1M5MHP5_9EURY|nr:hypothetical protein SAMN05443636_1008 [Halobaculum gomorrense]